MLTTTADWIGAAGSLIGGCGVIGALAYSAGQTKALREQLQLQTEQQRRATDAQYAALDMRLLERMIDIDQFFIEHAHLRPYMQTGLAPPDAEPLRAQVFGCAEMLIDFADLVAAAGRHQQLSRSDYESWGDFLQWYFEQSPAIREQWRLMGSMYPRGTRELLVPPARRGAIAETDGCDERGSVPAPSLTTRAPGPQWSLGAVSGRGGARACRRPRSLGIEGQAAQIPEVVGVYPLVCRATAFGCVPAPGTSCS